METTFVMPDTHYPLHDEAAHRCAMYVLERCKPTRFLHLGDVGENESVNHWRWKRKKKPPLEYLMPAIHDDLKKQNRMLNIVDAVLDRVDCKERIIIQGNHGRWWDYFVEEHPYMEDFTFRNGIMADERGYRIVEQGENLFIGDWLVYHGDRRRCQQMYHAAAHLRKLGTSVLYGHRHSLQLESIGTVHGTISACCLGCLKSLRYEDNDWLDDADHNWSHHVGILRTENGKSILEIVNIVDGIVYFNGRKFDGNRG